LAKKPEERYQSVADLVADLRRVKRNVESGVSVSTPDEKARRRRKILAFALPTLGALIIALFLIFKPFSIEIGTDKESAAAENSLAIMYFENVADPEDKDKTAQMITSLLITDLSESEYMSVVSQQRLYDILKLLGKQDLKVLDKGVASEVAKKAGVKWILTGKVIQARPNLVLTAEVSEATTGKILASQRVSGQAGEDLFAVVDKLSAEVKKDLALPAQASKEPDKPISEVTTHSPEAYRYYLEGFDYENKVYTSEAEKSYRNALALDSTFAMAYYRLAGFAERSADAGGEKLIAQAVKYSDKVSQKEKYYIKALELGKAGDTLKRIEELKKITKRYPDEKEAFYKLGDLFHSLLKKPKEAIPYLIKAIEIDPLYKLAYNELAYAYDKAGDFEKSIWAINKYISLAPDEPNPYDTRGDLYAGHDQIELAIESYKKALEKKPDFDMTLSKTGDLYAKSGNLDSAIRYFRRAAEAKADDYENLGGLGRMYLFKRDYARAESCFSALASKDSKEARWWARTLLASVPLYQGKLEEALAVLDQGIGADKMERNEGTLSFKHYVKAMIYEEKKNLKMALEEVKIGMEIARRLNPTDPVQSRDYYVQLLAEDGDISKAEEVAKSLKQSIVKLDSIRIWQYWYAVGWIESGKGDRQAALTNFEKAAKTVPDFFVQFAFGKAYLDANRLGEAVAVFEKTLSRYDETRAGRVIWAVKTHYLLGLAYEKSGWNNKAIEKYQEFLEIWKNADPGIAEVADARQRLARLKKKV